MKKREKCMLYEHSNGKPENITENWPGKWKVFSWLEFVTVPTNKKYTDNTFMFHLHNPINPLTGEHLGGGVGTIKYKHEM